MADQTITVSRGVQQLKDFLEEEECQKLLLDSHSSQVGESWGDCPLLAQLLGSFVDGCQSQRMPHAFGLLPCIALRSHPALPLQTTAQVADAVLGTAALQDQKTKTALHRLLPPSTSQLITGLQSRLAESNQPKHTAALPVDGNCNHSLERPAFTHQQVDGSLHWDKEGTCSSAMGMKLPPVNELPEQGASSDIHALPGEQELNVSPTKLWMENGTRNSTSEIQGLPEVMIQNMTENFPVHQSQESVVFEQNGLVIPALGPYAGQGLQSHQTNDAPPRNQVHSSLPGVTQAARRWTNSSRLGCDKFACFSSISPEQCSTPITAVTATDHAERPAPAAAASTPAPAAAASTPASAAAASTPAPAAAASTPAPGVAAPTPAPAAVASTPDVPVSAGPTVTTSSTAVTATAASPASAPASPAAVTSTTALPADSMVTVTTPTTTTAANTFPAVTTSSTTVIATTTAPSMASLTSTSVVTATTSPVSTLSPTATSASVLTAVLITPVFGTALGLQPVSTISTAEVVQQALTLYACWKELLSHEQLQAASLGPVCPSFGPALMEQFGGALDAAALAREVETLLEGALEVSAQLCRPPLLRPLLEVLEHSQGPYAAVARLRLFLRQHASLPEAHRAGLQHVLAHHPHNHRLRLQLLQSLQQLCPGDNSVLLLAQTLLDHPTALQKQAPCTADETVETAPPTTTPSATSCGGGGGGDTHASHDSSSSTAQPSHRPVTLAQTVACVSDSTRASSSRCADEARPGVKAPASIGPPSARQRTGQKKKTNRISLRTKCPLQKECVVQSAVLAVRALVRLLQFSEWRAVLQPWQLLRRALTLLHTAWIRCWQCDGCRRSREAVSSSVSVWWLLWWRKHKAPAVDSSASSATSTNASSGTRSSVSSATSTNASLGTSASPSTVIFATNSSGDSNTSSNVFYSADSCASELTPGSSVATVPAACSPLNTFSDAELAMHRAVVAHILCIDDWCGGWCDALRRGGWLNMARELKDVVGAAGPFKDAFTRYKRALLHRRSMLFSNRGDAGGEPSPSAPHQTDDAPLPPLPSVAETSVQCQNIETRDPDLETGLGPSPIENVTAEPPFPEHRQSCNTSDGGCGDSTLLHDLPGPAAGDAEPLNNSSSSTLVFHDDHLLSKQQITDQSQTVSVEATRMPQRTVSDRPMSGSSCSADAKRHVTVDSTQGKNEDETASKSVAEENSASLLDGPFEVKDEDSKEFLGDLLRSENEVLNKMPHDCAPLQGSSRDGSNTKGPLSTDRRSADNLKRVRSHGRSLTAGRPLPTGTLAIIESLTKELKEETTSDDAEKNALLVCNSKQHGKLNNYSYITYRKRTALANMDNQRTSTKSPSEIPRPTLPESSVPKPLEQRDGRCSTINDVKLNIANEDCSFSSNSEECNTVLSSEVSEVIRSLESPPTTKRRKLEAQNSGAARGQRGRAKRYCGPAPVEDKPQETKENSVDKDRRLRSDETRPLRRGAAKPKRPLDEMLDNASVKKRPFATVTPCFVRLQTLESRKLNI